MRNAGQTGQPRNPTYVLGLPDSIGHTLTVSNHAPGVAIEAVDTAPDIEHHQAMTESEGRRGWQHEYDESVAREQALHDDNRASGLTEFLIDIRLWAAAILVPFALAAIGLGWVAEGFGWSRWIGVVAASVLTAAAFAAVLVRRHANR